jgi:hypothetical protein
VVDVVEQADRDAALDGCQEGREDEPAGVRPEADVVESDVERTRRRRQEAGDPASDVAGPLPAVRQRGDLDRGRRRRSHV